MHHFLILSFFVIFIIWVANKLEKKPKNKIGKKLLPKTKYYEYINSQKWKNIAQKIRKRDGYACRLCNAKNVELHVHHSTYERLGYEADNDLITLCAPCHKKFHNKQ